MKKNKLKKNCIVCKESIHPKRLEILPHAVKCVKCSNTNKKAGVIVMKGEGDHTYLETIIIEHEDYIKYQKLENKLKDVEKLFTPETDDEEIVEEEDDNELEY